MSIPNETHRKDQDAEPVQDVMYQKHQKIYVRGVQGFFARWRIIAVFALLGLFYGLPWISWGQRQALLFDLPARKFYLFGLTLWPQDFFLVTMLMAILAFSLFFFTTLGGRLWCGYACPQTVWTEVFIWIDRLFEGDRAQAIKLDKSSWTKEKILRKLGKHAALLLFSLYTGYTFVGYFTPTHDLTRSLVTFSTGPWETFWVFFYGLATYLNAGFMREQVCIYMCPYARFQSAMFDDDTLIISYDDKRGEPRGARRKGSNAKGTDLGDCVDCTLCVQVCPVGIDIRNGLQYQCIACAACLDVCDQVMEKINSPKGLVRYSTQNAMEGKPTRVLRPRVWVYAALLSILIIGMTGVVMQRIPVKVDIIRDRMSLYTETADGLLENSFMIRVINMDDFSHTFKLGVEGMDGLTIVSSQEVTVPAGQVGEFPTRIQADPAKLPKPNNPIQFTLQALDQPALRATHLSRFMGPR